MPLALAKSLAQNKQVRSVDSIRTSLTWVRAFENVEVRGLAGQMAFSGGGQQWQLAPSISLSTGFL